MNEGAIQAFLSMQRICHLQIYIKEIPDSSWQMENDTNYYKN